MTKQEIKEAIAKGIAGQGTNVDGGGYLPKILDAIVDAIPEGASPIAPTPAITIRSADFENIGVQEAADQLNLTLDELLDLPKQLVVAVQGGYVLTRSHLRQAGESFSVTFGGGEAKGAELFQVSFTLSVENGKYTAIWAEL